MAKKMVFQTIIDDYMQKKEAASQVGNGFMSANGVIDRLSGLQDTKDAYSGMQTIGSNLGKGVFTNHSNDIAKTGLLSGLINAGDPVSKGQQNAVDPDTATQDAANAAAISKDKQQGLLASIGEAASFLGTGGNIGKAARANIARIEAETNNLTQQYTLDGQKIAANKIMLDSASKMSELEGRIQQAKAIGAEAEAGKMGAELESLQRKNKMISEGLQSSTPQPYIEAAINGELLSKERRESEAAKARLYDAEAINTENQQIRSTAEIMSNGGDYESAARLNMAKTPEERNQIVSTFKSKKVLKDSGVPDTIANYLHPASTAYLASQFKSGMMTEVPDILTLEVKSGEVKGALWGMNPTYASVGVDEYTADVMNQRGEVKGGQEAIDAAKKALLTANEMSKQRVQNQKTRPSSSTNDNSAPADNGAMSQEDIDAIAFIADPNSDPKQVVETQKTLAKKFGKR